jgi:glucuronate isomerase
MPVRPQRLKKKDPDRYFDPDPKQRKVARELYEIVVTLPLVCPHGHVDPALFAAEEVSFGSPVDLLILPDHYVVRMLYSQGIPLESIGVPRLDGRPVEKDHRKIWKIFAENFYLFRGTPSGVWFAEELRSLFGIGEKLDGRSAGKIYDRVESRLRRPEFRPRALFERFNIEVLCTTDAATDPLVSHLAIRKSGWQGRIIPTFRPDGVINLLTPGWKENIQNLGTLSGITVDSYPKFIAALENRRAFFKKMGARATDHSALTPQTEELSPAEAGKIFRQALKGRATQEEATRFTAHMLMESARMSIDDGLVMQIHPGSLRNHNPQIYSLFGPDRGADIPIQTEYTRNLKPLLNKYGNHPGFTFIVFTLDEAAYGRELAPLAGHYPAMRLGPPWWFFDSINGLTRFRMETTETAGIYNTVGFNDDTRAFPSIPARHDLFRRVDANWIAGLVVRGIVGMEDAREMIRDTAYRLPKKAYKL